MMFKEKKEFHSFLLKKAWNSFKIIGQRLGKLCWLIVSFHVSFIHKTKITKYFSAQHDLYIEKSKFYKWFLFENGLFWCHERKSIISSKKSWGRIKVVKFSLKAMFATKILHLEKRFNRCRKDYYGWVSGKPLQHEHRKVYTYSTAIIMETITKVFVEWVYRTNIMWKMIWFVYLEFISCTLDLFFIYYLTRG